MLALDVKWLKTDNLSFQFFSQSITGNNLTYAIFVYYSHSQNTARVTIPEKNIIRGIEMYKASL